jgi:hypothetical protein
MSSTQKVVLCPTLAFWYKSLDAVLHTQGRPLSNLAFWYKSIADVLHTQGRLLFHLRFAEVPRKGLAEFYPGGRVLFNSIFANKVCFVVVLVYALGFSNTQKVTIKAYCLLRFRFACFIYLFFII